MREQRRRRLRVLRLAGRSRLDTIRQRRSADCGQKPEPGDRIDQAGIDTQRPVTEAGSYPSPPVLGVPGGRAPVGGRDGSLVGSPCHFPPEGGKSECEAGAVSKTAQGERQYRDRRASRRLGPRGSFAMDDRSRAWFVGVDGTSQNHHAVVVDATRRKLDERSFRHGGEGLAALAAWIVERRGARPDAVEVPHGPVVDSFDNALAETVIGLFKTEVIRRPGPWRSLDAVELATLALGPLLKAAASLSDCFATARNGSTGSITAACWSRSASFSRPRPKPRSTTPWRTSRWPHKTQTNQPPGNPGRFTAGQAAAHRCVGEM